MIRAMGIPLLLMGGIASAATAPCGTPEPVALRVQIGATRSIAQLRAGAGTQQLQVLLAGSGAVLWSAGPGPTASQHLLDPAARFTTSLAAIDTDSDGLHDRIYAGDLAGRLWRIDLANGEPAASFARASLLANLGDSTGTRGLVAAADVWRTESASGSLLVIAIGTVGAGAANRFHVLYDTLEGSTVNAGYHLDLGERQVITASTTVHGNTTFAAVRRASPDACTADFAITTLANAAVASDTLAPTWVALGELPTHSQFTVSVEDAGSWLRCRLAEHVVAACSTPVPVIDRFWRREDAD